MDKRYFQIIKNTYSGTYFCPTVTAELTKPSASLSFIVQLGISRVSFWKLPQLLPKLLSAAHILYCLCFILESYIVLILHLPLSLNKIGPVVWVTLYGYSKLNKSFGTERIIKTFLILSCNINDFWGKEVGTDFQGL